MPPQAWRVPLIAAGAVGAGLAASAIVFLAARSPDSPPLKPQPITVTPPKTATPAPTVPPAPAPTRTAPKQEAAPSADIEPGPVTLIWKGRVRSAIGAAPPPGSPCTLTARLTSDGNRARRDLLSLQCRGRVLYDSSMPLEGMSNNSFGVGEQPIAATTRSYAYVIRAEDVGARSGGKAQISVNSGALACEAYRDTAPSFRVSVALERNSQARQGRPLFTETIPAFADVVTRTARVTEKTGSVPFSAATCKLVIAPAYAKGHTCRVTLTCQGKAVYGAGTTGYANCVVTDGKPTSLADSNPTPSGGDPQLHVDLTAGSATLGDTLASGRSYLVQFALSP